MPDDPGGDLADRAADPAGGFADRADDPAGGFANDPIDAHGLPRLADHAFEPLDPAYLRVRQIGSLVFGAVVVIATVVLAALAPIPPVVPLAIGVGLLVLTGIGLWLQRLEVRHLGYLVRDKDFSFRSGVIQRSVATVPFARVQHVSIQRGPLERWFGLATLQMKTAGDDVHVPGMHADTAARLKDLVVDRAGAVADEEFELRER